MPLSFRTLRHLVPSSFRVKVTLAPEAPGPLPPSLSPLPRAPPPELAVALPEAVAARRRAAALEPLPPLPADEPDPTLGVPGPAAGPAVEEGVCDPAFAVCGAGAPEGAPVALVDWLTEVEPAEAGDDVLFVSCCTTAEPPGEPSLLAASRTAIDGFEPPDPLTGTVVLGTALTVVLVVGATVVTGAPEVFPGELSAAGALVP